jgi:hypothetical protein
MNLKPANQGIREFLAAYCKRESPKYAVMITGEWGSGKTWLVNNIMSQEGLDHLRISLFGISTRQEVYDEFFAQCHPMLASAGTKIVAGIARGLLTRITFPIGSADVQSQSQLDSLGLKELLVNIRDKIVVLDDFERCRLPVREALGLISNLLDDDNCKIVIISNDTEIHDAEYIKYKEKVVAYTFRAEPEAELALDEFWNVMARHRLDNRLVNELKEIIGIVHDQSDYRNLRHLKISLEAFERLYSQLPESAKQIGDLVKELLYIHSVFAYEVLHGSISGKQVVELFTKLVFGSSSDSHASESDRMGMLADKYRPSLVRDLIIVPEIWIDLFATGSLDKQALQNSIEASRFFIDQNTPTWRKILEVWSISNEELQDLLAQLQEDIRCENFSNAGEILHVTGILLWLSAKNLYSEPPEKIVEASVVLLNSLHSQHKLECRPGDRHFCDKDNVFANIFYFERKHPSFQQVLGRAKEIEEEIHQSKLERSASDLLEFLPNDVFGFTRQLVHAHLGDRNPISGLYADQPILASTDSTRFVQSLMYLRPSYRRDLLYGIAQRYKHPEIARMLSSELQWLEKVNTDLNEKLAGAGTSLEAFQLKSAIDEYLAPSLENLRTAGLSVDTPEDASEDAKS